MKKKQTDRLRIEKIRGQGPKEIFIFVPTKTQSYRTLRESIKKQAT